MERGAKTNWLVRRDWQRLKVLSVFAARHFNLAGTSFVDDRTSYPARWDEP